ncbi:hypothetical protein B0T17DRAFT_507298 [Bombardia bombarda]|uniref:Uncharacterized protein n=1 Tax=Bombardia bombarda TaxID=252184 RepID=A0AA40CA80_9PEZI|nr:hypothetical protein B0T17DRAFT_507298 [Bombardia bombarda]
MLKNVAKRSTYKKYRRGIGGVVWCHRMMLIGYGSVEGLALQFFLSFLALIKPSLQYTHYDPDCRISFYFALIGLFIATIVGNKGAVKDSVKGLSTISTAILIVLIRNTVQGSFAIFEWQIVYPMVFMPSWQVISNMWTNEMATVWGLFGLIFSFISSIQPWIYWKLVKQGYHANCGSPRILIFVFFDLYNPTYIRFVQVMSCIGNGRWVFGGIFLFVGVIIIVFTELILWANHVDLSDARLDSTSQLIPFMVGLFTMVSTVWTCIKDSLGA